MKVDIRLAKPGQIERGLCVHPFLAAELDGRAANPDADTDLWIARVDDNEAGWLCKTGQSWFVAGKPEIAETAAEFICAVGYSSVLSDLELPLAPARPRCTMEWRASSPILPEPDGQYSIIYGTMNNQRLSVVDFSLLQLRGGVFANNDEAGAFAVRLSRDIKSGRAGAVGILAGGKLVSGAAVARIYNHRSILIGVVTDPEFRCKGFARAAVTTVVALSCAMGARPLLCCSEDLQAFYKSIGFSDDLPMIKLYRA